jgi:hypothetical protein
MQVGERAEARCGDVGDERARVEVDLLRECGVRKDAQFEGQHEPRSESVPNRRRDVDCEAIE